jgi:hypothetical protein
MFLSTLCLWIVNSRSPLPEVDTRRPGTFLIVSADLGCGLVGVCSSAPSSDAAATGGPDRSGEMDEYKHGGGLLCYVPGHFDWLLFNSILVWSDVPR